MRDSDKHSSLLCRKKFYNIGLCKKISKWWWRNWYLWFHDNQQNDSQQNDTQQNDNQQNDNQQNDNQQNGSQRNDIKRIDTPHGNTQHDNTQHDNKNSDSQYYDIRCYMLGVSIYQLLFVYRVRIMLIMQSVVKLSVAAPYFWRSKFKDFFSQKLFKFLQIFLKYFNEEN